MKKKETDVALSSDAAGIVSFSMARKASNPLVVLNIRLLRRRNVEPYEARTRNFYFGLRSSCRRSLESRIARLEDGGCND